MFYPEVAGKNQKTENRTNKGKGKDNSKERHQEKRKKIGTTGIDVEVSEQEESLEKLGFSIRKFK